MLVLYIVLVLSTIALVGTALAIIRLVRRHMRASAAAREKALKRRRETATP